MSAQDNLRALEKALGYKFVQQRRKLNRILRAGGCPPGYPHHCQHVAGALRAQRNYCTQREYQCRKPHSVNDLAGVRYRKKYRDSPRPELIDLTEDSPPRASPELIDLTEDSPPRASPELIDLTEDSPPRASPELIDLTEGSPPTPPSNNSSFVVPNIGEFIENFQIPELKPNIVGNSPFNDSSFGEWGVEEEPTFNVEKDVEKDDDRRTILSLGLAVPTWTTRPGQPGFNREATAKFKAAGLYSGHATFTIECPARPPPGQAPVFRPMAYQKTVPFLLYPRSPVNRMLVVHRTGAGKSYTMVMCLDNFFHDPRPKVIIFPTESVKNNFYGELLKFPNRYAAFCQKRYPTEVALIRQAMSGKSANPQQVAAARLKIINLLEMKGRLSRAGKEGELAAPLRTYSYTRAGGHAIVKHVPPTDPIFKKNFRGLAYSGKVVLMDEVHNLVTPSPEAEKYKDKLRSLSKQLSQCERSVVVGFTATPMKSKREEGERLLNIIKGPGARSKNNEGFVSWFNSMPLTTYPEVLPCDKYLGNIIRVEMKGANAKMYKQKHGKRGGANMAAKTIHRLQNYCNGPYQTQYNRLGNRFSPSNAANHATKLFHIAKSIADRDEKCLVIIHRTTGYKLMVKMMESIVRNKCGPNPAGGCWIGAYERGVEVTSKIEKFSEKTNKGQTMRAMVIDAKEFSEGVSFKGVRRLILVNPPLTYADYNQRIGRALRSCDRPLYTDSERNVTIDMYVATHPSIRDTADEIALDKIYQEKLQVEKDLNELFKGVAVDGEVLKGVATVPADQCSTPTHQII